MAIVNVTPDSFYEESRMMSEEALRRRIRIAVSEGATFIDIGGCSTRPDSVPVTECEETERLRWSMPIVSDELKQCERSSHNSPILSTDTFRPAIAKMMVDEYGVGMVNDVTGGSEEMFRTVAELGVPYVLTHQGGGEICGAEGVLCQLSQKVNQLHDLGVADVIIDPGFGFNKDIDDNYRFLAALDAFEETELPLLVGISRKRMIWQLLDTTVDESLAGTIVAQTLALLSPAVKILRVHDVKPAVESIRIVTTYRSHRPAQS